MNRNHSTSTVWIRIAAAFALMAAVLVGCAQEAPEPEASEPAPSAEESELTSYEVSASEKAQLEELIGDEKAAKLIKQAETDERAAWIATHVNSYDIDGIEVQVKILTLAADEPASLDYVRAFPERYPEKTANDTEPAIVDESDLGQGFKTNVPHFFQWDLRWSLVTYSSASFGLTGCGPTSMAMVYQGMTGNDDLTPYDMAVRAEEAGFMTEFNGTETDFFFTEAENDGFHCYEIPIDADTIRDTLRDGNLIVANLGPGFFTIGGHFFVLAGLDQDGKLIVNDPYSFERSKQKWDADFIASESIALFAFSKDEPVQAGYQDTYNPEAGYDTGDTYDEGYYYEE